MAGADGRPEGGEDEPDIALFEHGIVGEEEVFPNVFREGTGPEAGVAAIVFMIAGDPIDPVVIGGEPVEECVMGVHGSEGGDIAGEDEDTAPGNQRFRGQVGAVRGELEVQV